MSDSSQLLLTGQGPSGPVGLGDGTAKVLLSAIRPATDPLPQDQPEPPVGAGRARLFRRGLVVVLTGCVALAWLFLFRPLGLGGVTGYVIVAGNSMQPTYQTGDLVITRSTPTYEVGDVVAFRIPDDGTGSRPVVIHRIIEGDTTEGYVLQGDNNDHRDLWRPLPQDVLGRAWLHLPHGGLALAAPRSPLALAALTAVFAFLAVAQVPFSGRPSTLSRSCSKTSSAGKTGEAAAPGVRGAVRHDGSLRRARRSPAGPPP